MPKLIFSKNTDVTKGTLYKIAKDQSHIDNNADWNQEDYNIVEISQSDFDAIRLESKNVVLCLFCCIFYWYNYVIFFWFNKLLINL